MPEATSIRSRARLLCACIGASTLGLGVPGPAPAQIPAGSPVYLDDSPRTADALIRAQDLAAAGNIDEAVAILQDLLDTDATFLIADPADPDLYITVRVRVQRAILSNPEILAAYRRTQTPIAERQLAEGMLELVERSRLLTTPGLIAALRLAQNELEEARFEAAWWRIEQLDRHPDRRAHHGALAAQLLAHIARYAGYDAEREDPSLRRAIAERLAQWRSDAGLDPATVAASDRPHIEPVLSPAFPGEPVELDGLLARPLWSAFLGEPMRLPGAGDRTRDDTPPNARFLDVWPVVHADHVFINDGQTISAWNRFTLTEKWRIRIALTEDAANARYRGLDEPSTLAVSGNTVVAITGTLGSASQFTDRLALALDAETGRVRWARRIADFNEPVLEESTLRGGVVIDQGTVTVTAVKDVTRRRLESVYAIGLDLVTGDLRWVRQIGSAGRLPYGTRNTPVSIPVARSGIIYRADRVGVLAANESATGRVRWARRVAPEFSGRPIPTRPWQVGGPIFVDDVLFSLSPDQLTILAVNPADGTILSRRSAGDLDGPEYLIPLGDLVVGVSANGVVTAPAANLIGDGPSHATSIARFGESGIRGRVVVAGDELLIPTTRGLTIVDPRNPADAREIPLDRPGNLVPLRSQLVVVDDIEVHTYLLWDVAERILRERMTTTPHDAAPAVTYAELAYRANRPQSVLPAIDHALRAIERDPLSSANDDSRARLFRALLDMVQPDERDKVPASFDDAVREQLVDRLGLAAASPIERVAYLMAAGQFYDGIGRPQRAVESYQTILENPALAQSAYTSGRRTVLAEREATDRLSLALRRHGRAIYAAYDAEAERRLRETGEALSPEAFETIARRYPLSLSAPRAWLEAGTRYQRQGRPHLAAFALEEAYATAMTTIGPVNTLTGEIAGRLILQLERSGRLAAAVEQLEAIERDGRITTLTSQGSPLDAVAKLAALRHQIERRERRPRIGPAFGASTEILGWAVLHPTDGGDPLPTDSIMMKSRDDEIALWRLNPRGQLEKIWGDVRAEAFHRVDSTGAYFSRPDRVETRNEPTDWRIVKRDFGTGAELWSTPSLRALLAIDLPQGPENAAPRIDMPLHPGAAATAVTYAIDAATLVVMSRAGACAAFDVATGDLLWKRQETIPIVYDSALSAGVLVLGGVRRPDGAPPRATIPPADWTNTVLTLDARTGDVVSRHDDRAGVRWVQVTEDGHAIIGVDTGVISLDAYRGQVRWRNERDALAESLGAWLFPGRIIVKNLDDELWQIVTETGAAAAEPLDLRNRMIRGYTFNNFNRLGPRLAVSTRYGVCIFDREGALVGVDGRDMLDGLLPAAFADTFFLTLSTEPEEPPVPPDPNSPMQYYALQSFTINSGRLVARSLVEFGSGANPASIALVDGKVLITLGSVTKVIDAP